MPKGNSSRRGLIIVALNGLVSTGVIAGFRTWKWRARPRRARRSRSLKTRLQKIGCSGMKSRAGPRDSLAN